MMMPPSCTAQTINPSKTFTFNNHNTWTATDLAYSFTLPKQAHVIALYHFSGLLSGSYIVMRLSIDSRPQAHTVSITGNTRYAGNFGLWQGFLNGGDHTNSVDYRTPIEYTTFEMQFLNWRIVGSMAFLSRLLTVV